MTDNTGRGRNVFWAMIIAFGIIFCPLASGEDASFEFIDQDIREILYAVSVFTHIPIAADDTVTGTASFRFAGGTFDRAFEAFLKQTRLYVKKERDLWTVSRVRIQKLSGSVKAISVDASDVAPSILLEKLALECGIQFSWQTLPTAPVSVHTGFLSESAVVASVVSQFPGYKVTESDSRYVIEPAKEVFTPLTASTDGVIKITEKKKDGVVTYSVDITRARFLDAMEKLFLLGGRKFCFTVETDIRVPRALFTDRTFDKTVRLLASQAGMDTVVEGGIYFFVPVRDKAALMSNSGKSWRRYEPKFITQETFAQGLSLRFSGLETILLPDRSLLCLAGDSENKSILSLLADMDAPVSHRYVTLRYVTVDFFVNNLPPWLDARFIGKTGNPNSFFFTGSPELFAELEGVLDKIDKPQPQIRYDLLIVQFQETSNTEWKPSLSASTVEIGDRTSAAAQLGSVLNLNFNVVTVFGINFAASLQAAISENMASVFADTTLHGVSGQTISFKNTNTYRYKDAAIDPETGKPLYTGVTREIVAGLTLDVTGSVSGDGMITSKVTAQVSRRGADVTSTTGNPPPTSEKSITTEVRSRSGEPVVLSGLVQDDSAIVTERIPFISRIPLLGWFFKARTNTKEKTEMIIYLVPHVAADGDKKAETTEERYKRLYAAYVEGGAT